MKCPHCGEDLGINSVCITPSCSSFGNVIILNDENKNINNINKNLEINTNNTYENISSYNKNSTNTNDRTNYNKSTNQYNYSFNKNDIDITDEEFIAFVGDKKKDYYLEKFNIFKTDNKFGSWNWPAFLFSGFWLLYRKMYLLGILLLCLKIFIIMLLPFFSGIVTFIISILIGIFGNNLYIRHTNKRIKKIKNNSFNIRKEYYFRHIRLNGETNIVAIFISGLIYLVVIILLMTFTIAKYSNHYSNAAKHNNNNNNNRYDNHSFNEDNFNDNSDYDEDYEFDDDYGDDDSNKIYNKYDAPIDSPIHNY